mmetsp:Transcript_2294/g.6759  ORF Transcript_2294/g.6759 Transcript_2294/m.6759 type:complete len:206 (+) Transcript_2294:552-1169(+)
MLGGGQPGRGQPGRGRPGSGGDPPPARGGGAPPRGRADEATRRRGRVPAPPARRARSQAPRLAAAGRHKHSGNRPRLEPAEPAPSGRAAGGASRGQRWGAHFRGVGGHGRQAPRGAVRGGPLLHPPRGQERLGALCATGGASLSDRPRAGLRPRADPRRGRQVVQRPPLRHGAPRQRHDRGGHELPPVPLHRHRAPPLPVRVPAV